MSTKRGHYGDPRKRRDEAGRALALEGRLAEATRQFREVAVELVFVARQRDAACVNLEVAEAALADVRQQHRGPRTLRHGSGCVGCGLVWPCPTFLALPPERRREPWEVRNAETRASAAIAAPELPPGEAGS